MAVAHQPPQLAASVEVRPDPNSRAFPYPETRDVTDCAVPAPIKNCFLMHKDPGIAVEAEEKLHWLRRLDHCRDWKFLDDERYCLRCGMVFTGRQARLLGGTRPHGPLRFRCPTTGCSSTPEQWVHPYEVRQREHHSSTSLSTARVFRFGGKINGWVRPLPIHLTKLEERHPRLRSVSTLLHYFGLTI